MCCMGQTGEGRTQGLMGVGKKQSQAWERGNTGNSVAQEPVTQREAGSRLRIVEEGPLGQAIQESWEGS